MTRSMALGELLLGVEGAALLQNVFDGEDGFVAERIAAIEGLLDQRTGALFSGHEVPELDVERGYAAWAPSYDAMANALIRAEEPLVARALDGFKPGDALDAACGTGRHAGLLVARGHRTIGVDRSEAMLSVARSKLAEVDLRLGDLVDLPVETASMDVVVCALALTHLADPAPAIAELARVTREGGRVVVSDAHPFSVLVQGQALFAHERGLAFIRNHVHLHSTYLRAFRAAGLSVLECLEAPMQPDFANGLYAKSARAAAALWDDLPAVLVWVLERRRT